MAKRLSHYDRAGRVRMVDVGGQARHRAHGDRRRLVRDVRRGAAARCDGRARRRATRWRSRASPASMAAKRTSALIPLCHPLAALGRRREPSRRTRRVSVTANGARRGKTGVEMEALTAVSVAALTIYDMVKAADRAMTIERVRLVEKTGGRSGHYRAR